MVGINSQIFSNTGGSIGVSFAIPIEVARSVAEQLRTKGKVSRGSIGVQIQRIDRDTGREDVQLTIWSNESMKSKAFDDFHLSDLELGVKSHHDHVRNALPVVRLQEEPRDRPIAEVNRQLTEA